MLAIRPRKRSPLVPANLRGEVAEDGAPAHACAGPTEPVSLGNSVVQRTEHAEEQWELWKPLEGLMDRLFPKELFGASPPREARASPDYFDRESNNMLESFYVVPDYQVRLLVA